MVEMLGVLAIIGVLSVAGIAGYTTAMRSYRTNEIVNAASQLYVLAMAQNAGNGPSANVAYTAVGGTNPSGVSTLEYDKDAKSITITFTDPNDCTMALNKLGDKATADCTNNKITVNFEENEENNFVTTCDKQQDLGKHLCMQDSGGYSLCTCGEESPGQYNIGCSEELYSDNKCKTQIPFDCQSNGTISRAGYHGTVWNTSGYRCECTNNAWSCEWEGE